MKILINVIVGLILIASIGLFAYATYQENQQLYRWDNLVDGLGYWLPARNKNITSVNLVTSIGGSSSSVFGGETGSLVVNYTDGISGQGGQVSLPSKVEAENISVFERPTEGQVITFEPKTVTFEEAIDYLKTPGVEFNLVIVQPLSQQREEFIQELVIVK